MPELMFGKRRGSACDFVPSERMRILIVNDGVGDAGGVETYLDAVSKSLLEQGHPIRCLHHDARRSAEGPSPNDASIHLEEIGPKNALAEISRWEPDLVFSHNMRSLAFEAELCAHWPVVKFMHGYFGTCISGQKMFELPRACACSRRFGAACLALYFPRRCGKFGLRQVLEQYRWAVAQKQLFAKYAAIVVASDHMRREYVRNGAPEEKVHVLPLFAPEIPQPQAERQRDDPPVLLFVGRMTKLKGGDLLIRAAGRLLEQETLFQLVFIGDGPQRSSWEHLAMRLEVPAQFVGWLGKEQLNRWYSRATLLVVPSVWPEPFGLVGLEAAHFGAPSVAFDVGGISEWLVDGENGILAAAQPPNSCNLAIAIQRGLSCRLEKISAGAKAAAERKPLELHLQKLETIFQGALQHLSRSLPI